MTEPRKILAIGAACAMAFMPVAYCSNQEVKHRQKTKIVCIEHGGDWSWNSCRLPIGEDQ